MKWTKSSGIYWLKDYPFFETYIKPESYHHQAFIVKHDSFSTLNEAKTFVLNGLRKLKPVDNYEQIKTLKMNYTEEIPDYGDVMTIEEWIECVEIGFFTNDDGCGYFCKDGKMDRTLEVFSPKVADIEIDATHVCWFNK